MNISIHDGCLTHRISLDNDGGQMLLHSALDSDDSENIPTRACIYIPAGALLPLARALLEAAAGA